MGPEHIGAALRLARVSGGKTLKWVAHKTKLAPSTVCGIEQGKPAGRPLRPAAWKIARLFGLEIDTAYALRPRAPRGRA
jgi:transcriptional regulator with XRE-family HTH domain